MARFQLGYQTPPLVARQAGFSKLVLDSRLDRLNNIDMADTGANGFHWYRRLAWVGGATTVPGQAHWASIPTNAAGNFVIANGNLSILGGTTSNYAMSSACQNTGDPRGYSGHMYGGGFYVECDMSYTNNTFGGAAFWSLPKSFFLGTALTSPGLFTEIDFMEGGSLGPPGDSHSGMVHWHTDDGHSDGGPLQMNTGTTADGTMHKWSFLWKTRAQNGGIGLFNYYQDDVLQFSFAPPNDADGDAFALNFNGGFGTTVKRVKVWQHFDTPGD